MEQNENRLMSIGEAARALGITRRIILNYEAKGLLTPDKKEGDNGNRYYGPDSISRIRTIRTLQNLGLSLDDVYAYYNETTDLKPIITRLETLRDELNLNIEKLKERIKAENDYKIQTLTIPSQTVYCQTLRAYTVEEKMEHLRDVFTVAIRRYGSDTSKRMFFIQYPLEDPNLVTYCVAVPPKSQGETLLRLQEEKALCIFYHGGYESISAVKEQIVAFADENNVALKGYCRHIYLEGPPQHKDPEKFITQVALLIK